jgi:hypothetical protein
MSTNADEAIQQSQRIVDMRQRMLNNIAAGKPSHEGIDPEELRTVISALRAVRATAGQRGGTAKAAAVRVKQTDTEAQASLNSKLAGLGLDLD